MCKLKKCNPIKYANYKIRLLNEQITKYNPIKFNVQITKYHPIKFCIIESITIRELP